MRRRTRAARPKHAEHGEFVAWCSACRWDRMTPDEQAAHRAKQRASQPVGAGHEAHDAHHPGCPACEWARMSEPERDARRQAGRLAWRQQNPGRAAVRDALLLTIGAGPCIDCGKAGDTSPAINYETRTVVAWRCQPCWMASRGR